MSKSSTRKALLFMVAQLVAFVSFSQGTYVPLNTEAYDIISRLDVKYSRIMPVMHTSDKGYYRGDVARAAEALLLSNLKFTRVQQYQLQFLLDEAPEYLDSLQSRTRRPLWKFYREPASFLHYTSKKKGLFDFRLNPVFDLKIGGETDGGGRFIFSSVRGLEVRGNIKKVFSFYFNVLGNAARPPKFVTDKIIRDPARAALLGPGDTQYLYVPGQAYWKDYSSKIFKFNDGIDYFDARGYVNVNILKYLNISLGRDKFFIGNGQRSLFLSDFSAPYLFLKLDVKVWRVHYQSILAQLNSQYLRGGDRLLKQKYMAVHHLSIQATHWLNLGLFEGVIMNRSNHFELQYLNPIIFYRAVEHSIGSPDNVLIGGDFKVNFVNHISFYGQILFDEFNTKNAFKRNGWWANKWALQFGFKFIDILPNLDAQIETNIVRPFTYTHGDDINYSNYNQPLAHPLGANFYEVLFNVRYQPIPRLTMNLKYFVAAVGNDTIDATGALINYGGDILTSSTAVNNDPARQFGNNIGQGARATIHNLNFLLTYSPWHGIYVDFEMFYRGKSGKVLKDNISYPLLKYQSTFFVGAGIRLNIGPKRYDF